MFRKQKISKVVRDLDFERRYSMFWIFEVQDLPQGSPIEFRTRGWSDYAGWVPGYVTQRVMPSDSLVRRAARLYFIALEDGRVREQKFRNKTEIVRFVHLNIKRLF